MVTHIVDICSIGRPGPENIDTAVEIVSLSSAGAEIRWGVHWIRVGRMRVKYPAILRLRYAEKYTVDPTDVRYLLHRGKKTRLVVFVRRRRGKGKGAARG